MTVPQLPPVPSLKLGGSDAPATWYDGLLEMRVDLPLRAAGRATLRFHDPELSLVTSPKAAIGTEVTLGARRPGQDSDDVLLVGKITGVSVDQGMRRDPELVLTVDDAAHSMGRGTHITTYLKQSASDIVSMIARRYSLTPDVRDPSGASGRMIEYLMQADSDFDLLDALCERTGCDWWVEGSKLRFWGPVTSGTNEVSVTLGQDLVELSVRASGEHPDQVEVRAWDRIKQEVMVATAAAKDARRAPAVELFTKYKSPEAGLGRQTLTSSETPVVSLEEATDLARALRDDAVESGLTATGTVLSGVTIRPGVVLSVAAPSPVSGKYHVTAVEHVFRDSLLRTRFTAGDRRRRSLADTLGATGRRDQGMRHSGLVVGRVTNSNDPDKAGKVKVTFVGRADREESNWARVLCLGAGKDRGLVVLPEVGDEVLVGFESGDLRQPVVLGGLFGSQSTMPLVKTERDVEARSLTSRLGHVVEVKDGTAPGDQHVLLQLAGKKHELRMAKDKVDLVVPDGVPLSIKVGGQSSLVFDGKGSLTITAVNITMEAKGNLTTTSNGAMKIESKATLDMAGMATTLKANATLQVQSSGPATIKGMPVAIN